MSTLAEFAYNNSYQKRLQMALFEALYGRRCRTPLNWLEPGERAIFGPDIVQKAEERVANSKVFENHPIKAEELCRPKAPITSFPSR